ncbi:MAG: tetratricopeptide repeat protein [Woeseiaceae bacterium]
MTAINARSLSRFAIVWLALFSIVACAPTTSKRPPTKARANIEIQDTVGFTIVEKTRAGSAVRGDYNSALTYLQQGRHEEGVALLESVAESVPDLSAPHIDLGIAHHRAGDLDAAESNLLLAIESNPNHPIAHNELGIVYRKTGRFADARKSYETALSIYPGYHYARRNLAVLCDLYLADLDCALRNYEAYMATVPSDEEASMWIADLRNRLGRPEE